MIRLLLFAIFGFLLYTIVVSLRRLLGAGRRGSSPPPPEKSGAGEEMVKDPVCGTYLPKGDALRGRGPDGPVYFCSQSCAERYGKD